jgi:hypothetical protein
MKYALICPNEPVLDGYRVAQVETFTFPVGDPTYWTECADDVVADYWYFKDGKITKRTDISINNGLQSF